jgi:diacylglycerol kinase family enzyme
MPIPTVTPETPYYFVLNSRSGSADAPRAKEIMERMLVEARRQHEFFMIDDPKQIAQVAERAALRAVETNGVVVASGGDGTLAATAQAVLPTGQPFGIVPNGTFNYFGRDQEVPSDTEAAMRIVLDPELRKVQVGTVNDRVFLVNASLGLYPKLLQDRERFTSQYGRKRAVAMWAGIVSLWQGFGQLLLDIEVDGQRQTVRTPTLFVGNNQLQLERVGLPEADEVKEHRLAGIMVKSVSSRKLLWLALRGALGTLGDDDSIMNFAFQRLTVNAVHGNRKRRVEVATDGERTWMHTPLEFAVAPKPLILLSPKANAET